MNPGSRVPGPMLSTHRPPDGSGPGVSAAPRRRLTRLELKGTRTADCSGSPGPAQGCVGNACWKNESLLPGWLERGMQRWTDEQMSCRTYRHVDRRINESSVCKIYIMEPEPPHRSNGLARPPCASNLGTLKAGKVTIALGLKQHCISKNRIYDYRTEN